MAPLRMALSTGLQSFMGSRVRADQRHFEASTDMVQLRGVVDIALQTSAVPLFVRNDSHSMSDSIGIYMLQAM